MNPHHDRRPIPLYPYPLTPPTTQQSPSDSDEPLSDFPPIRVGKSTPEFSNTTQSLTSRYHHASDSSTTLQEHSEHRSSPSQSPGPHFPRRSQRTSRQLPNKPRPPLGLGQRNIVNMVANVSHWFHRISTNYKFTINFSRLDMLWSPHLSVVSNLSAAIKLTVLRRGGALFSKTIWSGSRLKSVISRHVWQTSRCIWMRLHSIFGES